MKKLLSIFAITLAATVSAQAASESHTAVATELVQIANPTDTFESAFISTFDISLQQMAQSGIPADKIAKGAAIGQELTEKHMSDCQAKIAAIMGEE